MSEEFFLLTACSQLDGSETTGPIVAMHYFRRVAQPAEQGNRRAAKKREPFEIICFAINLTAPEIIWRINQIGRRV